MFEDLMKELKDAEKKINYKIKEIEGKESEEDLYSNIDLKEQLWNSSDAVKGSSMFRGDLAKSPFKGAFPDIFKLSSKREKHEENIMKKYIYFKRLENMDNII